MLRYFELIGLFLLIVKMPIQYPMFLSMLRSDGIKFCSVRRSLWRRRRDSLMMMLNNLGFAIFSTSDTYIKMLLSDSCVARRNTKYRPSHFTKLSFSA